MKKAKTIPTRNVKVKKVPGTVPGIADQVKPTPPAEDQANTTAAASAGVETGTPAIVLLQHPIAAIFPPLDDAQLKQLTEDIQLNGQREPVLVSNGNVIDGWARYLACRPLGRTPITRDIGDDDPLKVVMSYNANRRQLERAHRALVAARIATLKIGDNQFSGGLSVDRAASLLGTSTTAVSRAL